MSAATTTCTDYAAYASQDPTDGVRAASPLASLGVWLGLAVAGWGVILAPFFLF
jgi:hypothetical protein